MKLQEMTVRKHMLLNYYAFMIDEQHEYTGIALGYGSLYNHADNSNAMYYYDKDKELMIFEAVHLGSIEGTTGQLDGCIVAHDRVIFIQSIDQL